MSLRVLRPGLFSTVQDVGRPGHRAFGVPLGGAFDCSSLALANALVGELPGDGAAALELTLNGGVFEAEHDLALGLAGAPMEAWVERTGRSRSAVRLPGSVTLHAGDRLILGATTSGARTYLAVARGWSCPIVLGSRSTERPLRAGDRLQVSAESRVAERWSLEESLALRNGSPVELRIVAGPDAPAGGLESGFWCSQMYRVSPQSNRMGVRLEGPPIPLCSSTDRLSMPVAPGAIQAAGGRPIVLGVAGGTMGGYPHLAHVVSADLPRLGQLRPGAAVRFRPVTLEHARAIGLEERRLLADRLLCIATLARDGLACTPVDQPKPARTPIAMT